MIQRRINFQNGRPVMGRMKPRFSRLWNCLGLVAPGSNSSATVLCSISRHMKNLIILCVFQVPCFFFYSFIYFFYLCMNIRESWGWAARDDQLVWLQTGSGFLSSQQSSPETTGCCCVRRKQMKATLSRGCECFRCFSAKQLWLSSLGKERACQNKSWHSKEDVSRTTITIA